MKNDNVFWIPLIFVILLLLGGWIGFSYMEAKTFNKYHNGEDTTLLDAMFAQLRVNTK